MNFKNDHFINPFEYQYKYVEYIEEQKLICPIYFTYYIFNNDCQLINKYYLYHESGKIYKVKQISENGVFTYIYFFPYYKNFFFVINDSTRISLYDIYKQTFIFNFKITRKNLIKDIYEEVQKIQLCNKQELKEYVEKIKNVINAFELLENLL